MSSIVLELQREALGQQVPITDLLRKALLVARKLKVVELEGWIHHELDGYAGSSNEEIPLYRHVKGTPHVWNPYHGWQPIMFSSAKTADAYSNRACHQPIAEIAHMISNHNPGGHFEIEYPTDVARALMKAMDVELRPTLHISASSISRITDSVRNIVLKWGLKLEEDGILGSDISFTSDEVKVAEQAHYTINNFYGDVVNSQVQQGTSNSRQRR